MPRKHRLFIPDQPVYLVKLGHNREPIVARKADCGYIVECLALSSNEGKRYESYRDLFQDELDRHTLTQFGRGIEKGKAVGNPEFLIKLERMRNSNRGQA